MHYLLFDNTNEDKSLKNKMLVLTIKLNLSLFIIFIFLNYTFIVKLNK